MTPDARWLDPREERAWRGHVHAHHLLMAHLNRHLVQDSGLTDAEYVVLGVLAEHPDGRMSAQELYGLLRWEKSRLSHQVRRMQERGLVEREPNPADARSAVVTLLPAGRRAVGDAAAAHVANVRRHFVDLLTPAELDTLAQVDERIVGHLAAEPDELPVPPPE